MICTTKWVLSNYINKERTWDHFIFASLSFSDFCNFSQIAKFRRRQKKVFAIFYMNSCAFPHIFYEFSKLKYMLNLFLWNSLQQSDAAQKMKFSIKSSFSKCAQIPSFLWIWTDLLKKFLMENFIFVKWKQDLIIFNNNNWLLKRIFFST